MRNFQDTFETHKRSFINAFSICMTVPLSNKKSKLLFYFYFFSKFIFSTFERKIHLLKHHNILFPQIFLRMFFIFQRFISSLSSAFREIIGDAFLLQTHILIFICYGFGLCLLANKFCFLFFITKLQLIIVFPFLSGKS